MDGGSAHPALTAEPLLTPPPRLSPREALGEHSGKLPGLEEGPYHFFTGKAPQTQVLIRHF